MMTRYSFLWFPLVDNYLLDDEVALQIRLDFGRRQLARAVNIPAG
jgi:hypothetical protein